MNPIKTPREMLFELVELPRFAGGERVVKEFMPQIARAVAKFKQIYGKSPSPEDVQALRGHLESLSRPTTPLRTGPQAQVRAQYELATDPNLINPNAPDAFLTKAMTGRTQKGTALTPKPMDINDPNVVASIEQKQVSGALDDIVQPSTTPGSDAIARIATGMENQALGQGKIPLIDQIKLEFFKRNKRYPSDEELEMMIAEFNPLRHQYGEKGLGILGERPATAKGMKDWVSRARTEGISERTLSKPPSDYSQYAKDELMLQQGQLPGVRPLTEKRINPDRPDGFADGGATTPDKMVAEMAARGQKPSRLERYGKLAGRGMGPLIGAVSAPEALRSAQEGDALGALLHGTNTAAGFAAAAPKLTTPAFRVMGGASVPLTAKEAFERYQQGDRTGAVISAVQTALNAASMHPALTMPATAASLGLAGYDALRDKPEPRSVMEDYK